MPEYKDNMGIREKVHIELRGPDGKIKDERNLEEDEDETGKRPRVPQ